MSPRLKIKVAGNFVDVFHGEQSWSTWTRLRIERKRGEPILHPHRGAHLSQTDAQEVMQHVLNLK